MYELPQSFTERVHTRALCIVLISVLFDFSLIAGFRSGSVTCDQLTIPVWMAILSIITHSSVNQKHDHSLCSWMFSM